ncbi:MAG: acetyl-CoA carboxylase biotin carboxylase subunit [Bacteroidetes bacterium RIFCSPLOWO2_02_FULL_36_8]|nr:MAG: acetyl-CoA carboxylase biotin carboxylase subunit [Bacteroidetes bacterium RIFCSPLOWO2_02_FULL_36_8]OFY68902.1 MAG: acetyl-CoA carboxylase biotin carboxylase subunit [Bacteroidetes bacterium RIFCSPLOWO2_12_FULL_37_12]
MFKKILIANRGEIALRIIRTCREMGIRTVAVYSTADKNALHVRFADEAVCIGPPSSRDSYLNIPNIISAAEITNSDAIHPGYGFLSENARFSEICQENKIAFIGPKPEMIRAMGDKANAKKTMKNSGVPTIPGSDGLVNTMDEAILIANKIKYPVILKATAGGGGRGMRIIRSDKDFENAWNSARSEAKIAFGDDGVYIEKYVEEPRHIEIQIVGDLFGTVCHLSERDCTIQRRHQKLLEETPSPVMTDALREKMGKAAMAGAKSINYLGVGTIEFLVDKDLNFYFMEMNTRIQVEHPVTEEVIGYDLVKEQIKVHSGIPISGKCYYPKMVSMECRINAEDPFRGFTPSPGTITNFHTPGGHGTRVDTHVYAGYSIPPFYDSLIAKLIVTAQTRDECIVKMKRALDEFIIEGIHTTIPFHRKLMDDEKFRSGRYSTSFLEGFKMEE